MTLKKNSVGYIDFYAPYAVQQYMKNPGRVTVVRVLHLGGYSVDQPLFIYAASGSASGSGDTDAYENS